MLKTYAEIFADLSVRMLDLAERDHAHADELLQAACLADIIQREAKADVVPYGGYDTWNHAIKDFEALIERCAAA